MSNGIGLNWAKHILKHGYVPDKKDPMTTYAKITKKGEENVVMITQSKPMTKLKWNNYEKSGYQRR